MNLKDVPREGWLALATCGIWFGVGVASLAMALCGSKDAGFPALFGAMTTALVWFLGGMSHE